MIAKKGNGRRKGPLRDHARQENGADTRNRQKPQGQRGQGLRFVVLGGTEGTLTAHDEEELKKKK